MKKFVITGYTSEYDSSDSFTIVKVVSTEERAKELSEEWQAKRDAIKDKLNQKNELSVRLSKSFNKIIHQAKSHDSRPKLPPNYNMSKATAKDLGYTDEMWKNYLRRNEEVLANIKAAQQKWDDEQDATWKLNLEERTRLTQEFPNTLTKEEKEIWDYLPEVPPNTLHENYSYEEVEYED